MKIIMLYKYIRDDGGTTVSPVKPDCPYTIKYRIVADEGKILTNGIKRTGCIDVDTVDGWDEIDAPDEEEEDMV